MNIDSNFFWYPALLFPAMPILLLVFSNKYTALAMLIRKLHVLAQDDSINYLSAERIKILSERLLLLRWMQTFSSVSFLFNLITIFCVFVGLYNFALNFFIISVVFLILAIILFIVEAQHSHYALTLHIKDLVEYSENKIKSLIRKGQL